MKTLAEHNKEMADLRKEYKQTPGAGVECECGSEMAYDYRVKMVAGGVVCPECGRTGIKHGLPIDMRNEVKP